MRLCVNAFALSHVGLVRQNNEDNFYLNGKIRRNLRAKEAQARFEGSSRAFLAAVADGMGGAARGEAASLAAVRALRRCAMEKARPAARESFERANAQMCAQMQEMDGRMGSTLVALYIDGARALCCHVGDSRAYLLRDGALRRLTRDHNRAQQLLDLGVLTPEQARSHPSRHELTRHLGVFPEEAASEPEFSEEMELRAGDCFLLCSDGLCDALTDADVARALGAGETPQARAEMLLEGALTAGGRDNVTVLVAEIQSEEGMGVSEWIRATIRSMSRSLGSGRSGS